MSKTSPPLVSSGVTPVFTTPIPARGSSGNIFAIMGAACRMMRDLGISNDDIAAFTDRIMEAESYRAAVGIVREWFPVDLGEE